MNFRNATYNSRYLVGAYERLSREDDRVDESSSIESQKMIIESFAKYENFRIIKHYSDDGYTGSNFNRPNFEALKQDIEDGLINCVIVKDLSRLGREMYETGSYIEEYFLRKNVRFIAINDGYDSEIGDAMLGIRLSVNDLYLRDTSKKIRSSFDAKRKKGDYIGSYAKFGYLKDPDNPKKLIIDEYAAPIVHQVFEWIASGVGVNNVARRLTEQGISIPSIYKKENRINIQKELNNGKGVWRHQTIRDMATDKMYLGHMVQGRWRKLSYNSKKLIELPESEWFIVENTHPAIVSQELFDLVQKKLEKNIQNKEKVIGEKKYLFQGLLKCKECGHKLSITSKKVKNGFTYWTVCSHYAKYSKYERCTPHRMNYTYLEEDLLHYFKKIGEMFLDDINQDELIKESIKIQKSDLLKAEKELEQIKRNMIKIQEVISRLYEDRLNEVITVKQYSLMAKKYDQQIIDLEAKEEALNDKISKLKNDNSMLSYEECKKMMEEYMTFEHPTIELMNRIVDTIVVDKDNNVEVYFSADVGKYINLVVDKDETL